MLRRRLLPALALLCLAAATLRAAEIPPVLRGETAILLRVESSPLRLRVLKRDLNHAAGADVLVATLRDPFLAPVLELRVADDGQEGARAGRAARAQSAGGELAHPVPGVYRLELPAGDYLVGLLANCERYLVEGAVSCDDPERGGEIWFAPPAGAFTPSARTAHAAGLQTLVLADAAGEAVGRLALAETGRSEALEVAPGAGDRGGLWRLRVPRLDLTVALGGPRLWSFGEEAWFDLERDRILAVPRLSARHLPPGGAATIALHLHGVAGPDDERRLAVEAQGQLPRGLRIGITGTDAARVPWSDAVQPVTLFAELAAGAELREPVRLVLKVREEGDPARLGAALIELRPGAAPAGPVDLPLVELPFRHENWRHGYAPGFFPNEIWFDGDDRPWLRSRTEDRHHCGGLLSLGTEGWEEHSFLPALREAYPDFVRTNLAAGFLGAKVAFDAAGDAYTLLRIDRRGAGSTALLLRRAAGDGGWTFHPLAGTSFDLEAFVGHNETDAPPAVLDFVPLGPHPAKYAAYHRVQLWLPRKAGGGLELGEPTVLSESGLGPCQHSGGPPSLATREGRIHAVWTEIAPDDAPGAPTFAATVDRTTGAVLGSVLVGHAPPVNDNHNAPALLLDPEGFVHVITGAHGEPFTHSRSLLPNDVSGGFTPPVPVCETGWRDDDGTERGRQTYVAAVFDPQGTLHVVCRQWRRGVDGHHPGDYYGALSYQRLPAGGAWSAPRVLVVPPRAGYSIWYHRLSVDGQGALTLSYSYLSGDEAFKAEHPALYHYPALLRSADGGETWELADAAALRQGMD